MAWEENTMDYPQFDYSKTVMGALGIEMLEFSPERVVAVMPVTWKTHIQIPFIWW
jgi:acyl-coenzyme A thioesterase PaaI-like protein